MNIDNETRTLIEWYKNAISTIDQIQSQRGVSPVLEYLRVVYCSCLSQLDRYE